ncbi:transposase [Streptomyces parvulus]
MGSRGPPDSSYTSQSFIVIDSLLASSGPSRFSTCESNPQGPVRTKVALYVAAVFALLWDGRHKSFQAMASMLLDGAVQNLQQFVNRATWSPVSVRDRVGLELRQRMSLHDYEMPVLRSSGSSAGCVQDRGSTPVASPGSGSTWS